MPRGKLHNPISSSRKMTQTEKEVAQWRIDITPPGEWIINDIYGEEIWQEQVGKKSYGGVFRKAVLDKELTNIILKIEGKYEIVSSDGQVLYIVKDS